MSWTSLIFVLTGNNNVNAARRSRCSRRLSCVLGDSCVLSATLDVRSGRLSCALVDSHVLTATFVRSRRLRAHSATNIKLKSRNLLMESTPCVM